MLEASSAVTSGSIVATLTPVGQTTPEYQFSSFALTSGNNDGGSATTWTLTSSLSEAGLPLGRYTIEVAASD